MANDPIVLLTPLTMIGFVVLAGPTLTTSGWLGVQVTISMIDFQNIKKYRRIKYAYYKNAPNVLENKREILLILDRRGLFNFVFFSWKCIFPMKPHVRMLVGRLVGRLDGRCLNNFLKSWEVTLLCLYRNTCFSI